MSSDASSERPGKRVAGLVLIVLLAAVTVFCTIKGIVKFSEDKDLKPPGDTASAPFMRIYTGSAPTVSAMNVTVEIGVDRKSGAKSAFDWIHVVFHVRNKPAKKAQHNKKAQHGKKGQHKQTTTFNFKLALLCIPKATHIYPGEDVAHASVEPLFKRGACPRSAAYEMILTGTYSNKVQHHSKPPAAPLANLADDTTGVANISIPQSPKPMIASSSNTYVATFPHVTSFDACPRKTTNPQPSGGATRDDGPTAAKQETSKPCKAVVSFHVKKELDLPPGTAEADSQQQPPAAGLEIVHSRYALTWDDPAGNISLVTTSSPQETANSHVNEVYGAVYWGVAAAAGIAFFQELAGMLDDRKKKKDAPDADSSTG
jgi:hypothetical protein